MTIILKHKDAAAVAKQALLLIVVCASMVPFENVTCGTWQKTNCITVPSYFYSYANN
jgi:hypothetical protein